VTRPDLFVLGEGLVVDGAAEAIEYLEVVELGGVVPEIFHLEAVHLEYYRWKIYFIAFEVLWG
jgi:hypothetical protein